MDDLSSPADLLDLRDTVTIVTGAGGGVGAGIARRFAAAGSSLVLHYRSSATRVDELARTFDTPVTAVQADLTGDDGPSTLVEHAVATFGHADVLVNNAGAQPLAPLGDVDDDQWREVLDVNVTAIHRLTQAFVSHRRDVGGGGSIVHIASIEGHQPSGNHGHYATSKAAVLMHARAAAAEFGDDGIRVNVVSPGLIHRPGIEQDWPEGVERWLSAAPLGRLGTPEDVGDACVFLASGLARWVTGAELVVDGGILARPAW